MSTDATSREGSAAEAARGNNERETMAEHMPTPWHVDESEVTCVRADNGVYLFDCALPVGSHIVLCVNAHAALVEACEAASEALYAATACGAQSRNEQEQVNAARVQIESALTQARKG